MNMFDNMNVKTKENKHVNGRPWVDHGPFKTFEEAERSKIIFESQNSHCETKIKNLSDGFYLKTRKSPEQILKEEQEYEQAMSRVLTKKKVKKNV